MRLEHRTWGWYPKVVVYAPFVRPDETQREGWTSERGLEDGKLARSGIVFVSVNQPGLLAQRRDQAVDKIFDGGGECIARLRHPSEIIVSEHIKVGLALNGMHLPMAVRKIARNLGTITLCFGHVIVSPFV